MAIRCRIVAVLIITGCVLSVPATTRSDQAITAYNEADFLSRVRRLTFEGARAGEGYFSPSGTQLVFQSEREPGNPFYQIYVLDLETGDSRRISPGYGKTTCGFFKPGTSKIQFSSTHHDPESEQLQAEEISFRESGQERRYAWDYDPEMEHLRSTIHIGLCPRNKYRTYRPVFPNATIRAACSREYRLIRDFCRKKKKS